MGINVYQQKLASDRRTTYFKDIWASIAVATGIEAACEDALVKAWGLTKSVRVGKYRRFCAFASVPIGNATWRTSGYRFLPQLPLKCFSYKIANRRSR